MSLKPLYTGHPTIQTATWTKVNTKSNQYRRILLVNQDTTNAFRFIKVEAGASVAALTATDGLPLDAGAAGVTGGTYETPDGMLEKGDIYVYQASGGPLETLAVMEERDEATTV